MKSVQRFLSLLAVAGVIALAGLNATAARVETDVLTAELPDVRVPAGGSASFAVTLRIKPDHHLMANPASEGLVPTRLAAGQTDFRLEVTYPKGTDHTLIPGTPVIRVYDGEVTLRARLTAPDSAALGPARVPLLLSYQACTPSNCLLPVTVPLELPVEVLPAGAAGPPSGAATPAAGAGAVGAEPPGAGEEVGAEERRLDAAVARGLPWVILVVFLGGLALNLTPCVFPLLPVTMGFFASQGEHRVSRTFPMALVYVLSMAAVFSVLGVASALAGSQIGAFLQSVYGRAAIGLVLAILAASLFGAFEIRVPGRLLARFQGKTGLVGAVLMGGAVGLVAAPCVGPFVSTLVVYVAHTRDVAQGALLFFVLAVGLGTPYLFLGVFTGLINKVPRGGGYLVWFRRVLAFPLLALIVYFVSADLPAWLTWTLYSLIALAGAVYLGIVEGWRRQPWSGRFIVARVAVAMVFTAAAVGAFTLEAMPALGLGGAARGQSIPWQAFEAGDLDAARADGAPAVVYVTARWCSYCKTMDTDVFRDALVAAAARGVRLLKIDVTNGEPAGEAGRLSRQFARAGPPALVFFDARGRQAARRGQVGKDEFIDLLRKLED